MQKTYDDKIDEILTESESKQSSMKRHRAKYKKNSTRHFDSSSVTFDRIPQIMLMYGNDENGISARIDSIINATKRSGASISVYPSFESAAQPMSMASMLFDESDCVLIRNASELVSGKLSSKNVSILDSYLKTHKETKTIICITSQIRSDKSIELLIGAIKENGGRIVERNKPDNNSIYEWVSTYANDMGYTISTSKINELVSLVKDANDATSLINQLGNSIDKMSYNEIALSLKNVKKSAFWEYQNAIAACDIDKLIKMRKVMPYTKEGTSAFLISCRSALNDVIKMALDDTTNMSRYSSYQAKHGFRTNVTAVKRTRSLAIRNGGAKAFSSIYVRLCNMMQKVSFESYVPSDAEIGFLFSSEINK